MTDILVLKVILTALAGMVILFVLVIGGIVLAVLQFTTEPDYD